MPRKSTPAQQQEPLKCYLCENKIDSLDYRNERLLHHFVTLQGKIRPPRKTGTCTRHQRIVAKTIKRARAMAIMPVKRV